MRSSSADTASAWRNASEVGRKWFNERSTGLLYIFPKGVDIESISSGNSLFQSIDCGASELFRRNGLRQCDCAGNKCQAQPMFAGSMSTGGHSVEYYQDDCGRRVGLASITGIYGGIERH